MSEKNRARVIFKNNFVKRRSILAQSHFFPESVFAKVKVRVSIDAVTIAAGAMF